MKIVCAYCNKESERQAGHVNRAIKLNSPLFCNRTCAGLNRRKNLTDEQKKQIKKEYDVAYRAKNLEVKRKKAHEYHKKTYDPQKAAIERKAKMHLHIARMRQPKWVEYKKNYDKKRQAQMRYGELWECFLLVEEIQSQYDDREVRQINNLHNKSIKRKRQWQRTKKNSLQPI